MAITPYEALAMVPKSQEVSLLRTAQMQKENAQQAQIAGTVQQQTEQKMQRTEKADQKDETPFKYDAKEKGNGSYSGSGQGKKKQKEEGTVKESKKNLSNSTFDITI